MIPNATIHPTRLTRQTPEGYFMTDEVHYVCQCGFKKACPLTIEGKHEGKGHVINSGDDINAVHEYKGILL